MDDFDRLISDLISLENNIEKSVLNNSMKLGNKMLRASKRLVPVDTGTLKDSTYIKETSNGVELGYGDENDKINPKTGIPASKYMLEVHENLQMPHPNGGEAKFLEKAFYEEVEKLGNDFAKEVVKGAIK